MKNPLLALRAGYFYKRIIIVSLEGECMRSFWFVMLCSSWILQADAVRAEQRILEAKLKHLRVGTQREWADFPELPDAESLVLKFDSHKNQTEQTLKLRQQDVKQTWRVRVGFAD